MLCGIASAINATAGDERWASPRPHISQRTTKVVPPDAKVASMSESPSACSRQGGVWAPEEVARRGAQRPGPDISATYVAVGCSSLGLHCGLSRLNLTRLEAGSCGAASQVGLPEDEGGGGDDEADGGGGDGEADGGGGGGEAEGGGGVGAATLTTVIFAFMRECGPQK